MIYTNENYIPPVTYCEPNKAEVQRMNKQEAIKRLKEHISAITLYVTEAKLDEEEVENELLNIEAIDMAIEALQDDWIPVSERLPDYRRTVLISTKWGVKIASRDSINEGVTDDFWDCPLDDSIIATRYVTAWQPLPKPYKGGDTE